VIAMRTARLVCHAIAIVGVLASSPETAAAAAKKRPNMPRGWTWPPSQAMRDAGDQCLRDLDDAGIAYERASATKRVATPIVLPDLELHTLALQSITRKPPFIMDCHLARALANHASSIRAIGIAALRFSTIHEFRTIRLRGRKSRILSRHAIGMAMDVFEVELVDGSILEIERDYAAGHPILHALEFVLAGADELRTPLTPGNDPRSHADHFHIEAHMVL
jgi:hypothetical protein